MALTMTRPYKHPKTSVYWIRRVVPAPLRGVVGRRELKATLKTKDAAAAREAAPAVLARFSAILASAQAQLEGRLRALSPREVAEVCGQWYREQAGRPVDRTLSAGDWDQAIDYYAGFFPSDPDSQEDEAPMMPDAPLLSLAEGLLRARGLAVDRASHIEVALGLADAKIGQAQVQMRRLKGDWSADSNLARFPDPPALAPTATPMRVPPLEVTTLVGAWATETRRTGRALYTRQQIAASLARFLGHTDATRVTTEDAVRWKEARLAAGKAPQTVAADLSAMRPIWTWAKANRKLTFTENRFAGIAPRVRRTSVRPRVAYTDDDARHLLECALTAKGALRWLPWVLCFTGARLGEVCQSAPEDIQQVALDGPWYLRVHEDGPGRKLKNPQSARMIPLHPALIAEGFLAYVQAQAGKDTLWPDLTPDMFGSRMGTTTKKHGNWVRKVAKVTDRKKDPAHAWRHRFEEEAQRTGVPQNVIDGLMGHLATQNESVTYGKGLGAMPDVTAPWVAKMRAPVTQQQTAF